MVEIVKFRILGLSPFLANNPASMAGGATPKTVGVKKIPTPDEEAASKVYRNAAGLFYIQSVAFRSSVIGPGGGASGRKIGKRTANMCCSAGFLTPEIECVMVHPKTGKPLKDYQIYTCRAIVNKQGVLRSRPMFPEWSTILVAEIDTDFIGVEHVAELLNIAGKVAGVGDFRPQKRGMFGRYLAELAK